MATNPEFKFELGDRVKDIITGFTGIVYARIEWFNGCHRYALTSEKTDDKGKPVEVNTDSEQLQLIEPAAVKPRERDGAKTGGPYPDVHQRDIE